MRWSTSSAVTRLDVRPVSVSQSAAASLLLVRRLPDKGTSGDRSSTSIPAAAPVRTHLFPSALTPLCPANTMRLTIFAKSLFFLFLCQVHMQINNNNSTQDKYTAYKNRRL